jgi:hypothetical protein
LKAIENRGLPGLGGGWTLCATEDLAAMGPAEPLSGVFGRGGLVLAGECVLRPYRRGGAVRRFNEGTYLSPRRFRGEFDVHAAVWAAGFPTVEPIGYAYRRRLWGFEGVFVTRRAQGVPWPMAWDTEGGDFFAAQAADLVKWLSAWGLRAHDLNATNFLLAPDGAVIALDWDKANWGAGPRLLESHLKRLERSMKKLDAPLVVVSALRARAMGDK